MLCSRLVIGPFYYTGYTPDLVWLKLLDSAASLKAWHEVLDGVLRLQPESAKLMFEVSY
jgi:hypothetical protein